MADPPLLTGAVQDTLAWFGVEVDAVTPVGAPGTHGLVVKVWSEDVATPPGLVAKAWMWYVVLQDNPVMLWLNWPMPNDPVVEAVEPYDIVVP